MSYMSYPYCHRSFLDIVPKDLWSEFSELERSKESLLAVGLDLAPHYFNQVTPFHFRAEFSSPYFSS